jgi:hypothetical protein
LAKIILSNFARRPEKQEITLSLKADPQNEKEETRPGYLLEMKG